MSTLQAEVIQQSPRQFAISGVVDFSTTPALFRQIMNELKKSGKPTEGSVEIDLQQVTSCNSAALAFMFEVARFARDRNTSVFFNNLPAAIHTIARMYGVEQEIRDFSK